MTKGVRQKREEDQGLSSVKKLERRGGTSKRPGGGAYCGREKPRRRAVLETKKENVKENDQPYQMLLLVDQLRDELYGFSWCLGMMRAAWRDY